MPHGLRARSAAAAGAAGRPRPPLPLNPSVLGAPPSCVLSSSADVMRLAATNFSGVAHYTVSVPNDAALVGL
ncbi:MAG TPA: hypothetical protein VFZ65_05895 [Planctomycetota bacterium]|nr:hypothetical protein [Planctomycetota bacterium]